MLLALLTPLHSAWEVGREKVLVAEIHGKLIQFEFYKKFESLISIQFEAKTWLSREQKGGFDNLGITVGTITGIGGGWGRNDRSVVLILAVLTLVHLGLGEQGRAAAEATG